jgi:23S rRNA (pseudouridine1915-N3)-methyltransferase
VTVTVAVVGRPRTAGLAEAIAGYETRAARYWPLVVREVREERAGGTTPPEVVRRREGDRLREAAGAAPRWVCAEGGTAFTSTQFAGFLRDLRDRGRDVAFVIGGAYGVDPAVHDGAAGALALAPFTLPHELARLVLAEQLYRAGTIMRREPYHK